MSDRMAAYTAIQAQAEKAQRAADRAAGALDAAMAQLLAEFGCDSIEAAEALLVDLKASAAAAGRVADELLAIFEEAWGDEIRRISDTD